MGLAGVLAACGGGETKVAEPPPTQQNEAPPSNREVHDALVTLHKKAVETCFGGFGKGAPYALSMKLGKGRIVSAVATALSDRHGELPKGCIEDAFTGADLAGTDANELDARFAVENPDCELPACPPNDLPCTFIRDIACTVVID